MDDMYREQILEHYKYPRNKGALNSPTHTAEALNPLCGDEIRLELAVEDGQVSSVAWSGHGCAISQAAASLLSDELIGLTVEQVASFDRDEMLELIGVPLTPVRLKCGLLAWSIARSVADHHSPDAGT